MTEAVKWLSQDWFEESRQTGYSLLPFNFTRMENGTYLVTNLVGEYALLESEIFRLFARKQLPPTSRFYPLLKTRHFLLDATSRVALDLLAAKYRTKLAHIAHFTALHIFVVTLRCNNRCLYCQVSSQTPDRARYDMSPEIADKAVEFMFRSPSPNLKLEFQGGEPLLHFDAIKWVVARAQQLNQIERRKLEFVICTNLSFLTDEMIQFIQEHDLFVSTSLDGNESLHNRNRPAPMRNSYALAIENIKRLQAAIGPTRVSALMTTTRASLDQPESIIDEYVKLGFTSIFLRSLNPYGRSVAATADCTCSVEEWVEFYKGPLHYIIELNREGVFFREDYASIVLHKLLTPYDTGFVDLQSPSGTGISVLVYNYDGGIYPSDESRMLAEMGDKHFLLGNLLQDSYKDVVFSDKLIHLTRDTMLEGVPQCNQCALKPYCGSDPVRHYRLQGDVTGHKPTSDFCRKNTALIKHLIMLLETDQASRNVLYSWL